MLKFQTLVKLSFVVLVGIFMVSGCSTAQSRQRDQRLEDLERRVARMEFDNRDTSKDDLDVNAIMKTAKAAKQRSSATNLEPNPIPK